ncbi:MAG: right-handed parallel beta-helix repeat-containing protein [Planctomycetota bacterium]|nr:right-handed parallel beta-helix repeat-containing protein [Planctomycetota bacterium]
MFCRVQMIAIVVGIAATAGGATLRVPSQYPNIQAAMNAALAGDTVLVADGTYTGPGNNSLSFGFKDFTVRSENGPEGCIIDCEGLALGFWFSGEGPGSILDGFTITNGLGFPAGGIFCYYNSDPTLTNLIITGNEGGSDGGGGIYCALANPTISNCTITANTATDLGKGGGIYCLMSSPTISNCTIAGNTAGDSGGGVYCSEGSSPTIIDSIIRENWSGPFSLDAFSAVSASYSNIDGGWIGEGNTDADPLFVNPAGNDYHLSPGSPCIDAGDPTHAPQMGETDIDGEPRLMGCRVDMGADETMAGQPNSGDLDADGVVNLSDVPLFVNALLATSDPAAECVADINGDGNSDGKDVQEFVDALIAS